MIIGEINKVFEEDKVILSVPVEYANGKKEILWYSFDKSLEKYLTIEKHDGFVVALLFLAMKFGEDIYIQGKLSPKLYYNLSNYYMDIVKTIIPSFKKVKLFPEGFLSGSEYNSGNGVITGFSAGIDSFCTVCDHVQADLPDEYKVTHFLFNNVGSHGSKGDALFKLRYDLIKDYPNKVGIPFIKINSNLSKILNINFQQTHTPRNVSSVLLLQGLISKYYYASSYAFKDCYIGESKDIAYSDPLALSLLSTETLECISSGGQYSRVQKTERVSNFKDAYKFLNVCVSPKLDGSNCSSCWKCNRTLLTLELLGQLHKFDEVFDLNLWKKTSTGIYRIQF